jgi:glycerol-3-phosphate acyltransferase PlsY
VPILNYILVVLGAYLLGSIPFGYLVAKAKGIDIRSVGSGNIGATNAMRVLGKPAGIFVLLMDALKGYAAVVWLTPMVFNQFDVWLHRHFSATYDYFQYQSPEVQSHLFVLAGIFAVLGHNYTCWLRFKGGKGIATTGGAFLALAPWAVLVAVVVFILLLLLTKYVSVGSIGTAIALPTTIWVMTPNDLILCIVATLLGVMAIYKHKSNIQRLLAGTENRVGKKTSTPESTK